MGIVTMKRSGEEGEGEGGVADPDEAIPRDASRAGASGPPEAEPELEEEDDDDDVDAAVKARRSGWRCGASGCLLASEHE